MFHENSLILKIMHKSKWDEVKCYSGIFNMWNSSIDDNNYCSSLCELIITTESSSVVIIRLGSTGYTSVRAIQHPIDGSIDNSFRLKLGHGGTFESISN